MVNIRKADIKDINPLFALWKELIISHMGKRVVYPLSGVWREEKTKELQWAIESERIIIYIVESNDIILGYIRGSVRRNPPLYDIVYEGNIEEIYINPKFRRQGYATLLANAIIKEFEKREIAFINLHVGIGNKGAQVFWKDLGFDTISFYKRRRIGGENDESTVE